MPRLEEHHLLIGENYLRQETTISPENLEVDTEYPKGVNKPYTEKNKAFSFIYRKDDKTGKWYIRLSSIQGCEYCEQADGLEARTHNWLGTTSYTYLCEPCLEHLANN